MSNKKKKTRKNTRNVENNLVIKYKSACKVQELFVFQMVMFNPEIFARKGINEATRFAQDGLPNSRQVRRLRSETSCTVDI